MSTGYIEDYGANGNGSFDFDVTLLSEGITLNTTTGVYSGTGDVIYLDLNSSSSTGLADGTYEFSTLRENFTLVDASLSINFTVSGATGTSLEATTGSVTVDGNDISFTLTFPDGKTATGSFDKMLTPF